MDMEFHGFDKSQTESSDEKEMRDSVYDSSLIEEEIRNSEIKKNSSKILNFSLTETFPDLKQKSQSIRPKFSNSVDYKTLLEKENVNNELLKLLLCESLIQIETLKTECSQVEKLKYKSELRLNPKWKNRRKNFQLKKLFKCPYVSCLKKYASDHALQTHLKNKHQAGKKSQRMKYAEEVYNWMLEKDKEFPEYEYNLPENFIQTVELEFERLSNVDFKEPFIPNKLFNYSK